MGKFVDGGMSAGFTDAKKNEQLASSSEQSAEIDKIYKAAIERSEDFKDFTLAKEVRAPMISRYKPGMFYKRHMDAAILPQGSALRTDLSVTVFLSDPLTYEGGSLILDTDFGEIECRPEMGTAIIYDTGCWHEVETVTSGERLALVSWIQSRVRSPNQRAILFDMARSYKELASAAPQSLAAERLFRSYSNLLRMWIDV